MNIAGRILVVDGVPTTRITMKVRLMSACYEVAMSASAHEALRIVPLFRPQIVLIAASLPDMSQAELCHELRALPGGADLPILAQAQGPARIAALRAGASALIDQLSDDLTLLARIRGLMRRDPQTDTALHDHGMAEPAAAFAHDDRPRLACIAAQPATALGWRHALQGLLDFNMTISDPDRALSEAARGKVPDLYLIEADMQQPGEGLRLLSELRSRPISREAGFIIALRPERRDMMAVALDLGAGDVLFTDMSGPGVAAETAIRLEAQLLRKRESDRRRQERERQMLWAMVDPLTGLHNRRHALPRLAELFDRARAGADDLAVIALDLDRFKRVNDSHGHAAGDAVLQAVAQRLSLALPPDAILARMGGEEFLAVLPHHHATAAMQVAEEIRLQVLSAPVRLPDDCCVPQIHVSISAGVAAIGGNGDDGLIPDPETLLARADRALLAAKAAGRNRIMLATHPIAA